MYSRMHSWFTNVDVNSKARLRLFCFPYAGGGASIYRNWKREFPNHIEVCPVQLPGRESRSSEIPMESLPVLVRAIVAEMTPLLRTPFAFFGHSMGALIAFETARELHRKQQVQPVHLFASGNTPPHLKVPEKKLHLLPDDLFKQELRLLQGTPEEILQNNELMQILMPRLRADFAVNDTYIYRQGEPLVCPITAFGGTQDSGVSEKSLQAWKEHTHGAFTMRMFEGSHFFLHECEQKVTENIRDTLVAHLNTPITAAAVF